jgi:hypothetical protein
MALDLIRLLFWGKTRREREENLGFIGMSMRMRMFKSPFVEPCSLSEVSNINQARTLGMQAPAPPPINE